MKMIKYLLLAAVMVAFPAMAQQTKSGKAVEAVEAVTLPYQDIAVNSKEAAEATGELNNYEYRVEATDMNYRGKYKGLVAEAINEDKGYALVMQILPGGAVHKFCAGNEEVCKSISNGVECGDTWPAWCYLPEKPMVVVGPEPEVYAK